MLYAVWVVGVLLSIWISAKITKNKERLGKFDD